MIAETFEYFRGPRDDVPEHWARRLPEAGPEILRHAQGIENLWMQIHDLQAQLAIAENRIAKIANRSWSVDEMNTAQRMSVAAADWIEGRQAPENQRKAFLKAYREGRS